VSGGRAVAAFVDLEESTGRRRVEGTQIVVNAPNRLRSMTVDLPADVAPDVSLWVHSVGPDGDSTRTPVDVRVHGGSTDTAFRVADAAMSAFAVGTGTDPARLTISLAPGTASS
jgi:hypothetical protein